MATVQAQQSLRRARKGVCKMDEDLSLRLQCLDMAAGCFKAGSEKYNAHDVVLWAQTMYDFCKGNKPTVEGVPEDDKPPF